jgi:hypothetical protein
MSKAIGKMIFFCIGNTGPSGLLQNLTDIFIVPVRESGKVGTFLRMVIDLQSKTCI